MIISISGPGGSGKSTVAKLLAARLGLKRYYAGQRWRGIAKGLGVSLAEAIRRGESDQSFDREVDSWQKGLGESEDGFVIEGRTAFIMIPQSFKVYIDVSPDEGARRVMGDAASRDEGSLETFEATKRTLADRLASDRKRYLSLYGVDCFDLEKYDLVVDSTDLSPEEVAESIISSLPSF